MRILCILAAALYVANAGEMHRFPLASVEGARWQKARKRLIAWGSRGIQQVTLPGGAVRQLRKGQFAGAGCLWDVDSDGEQDLVVREQPDRLVWLRGPGFETVELIDTGASFADCRGTKLFGKRGVLITHRGMQVRFYEVPTGARTAPGAERWGYNEIYSIYTASFQSGLLERDVDEDGFLDLLCGNYWVRSPESYELPWRIFAINLWHEQPESAHVRLGLVRNGGGFPLLVVSQGAMKQGRLALFRRPPDPRKLWVEERLEDDLALPSGLAVADFDNDGREDFAIGEAGGGGRLLWWQQQPDGAFRRHALGAGFFIREMEPVALYQRVDLAGVTQDGVFWWENVGLQ